jgi:class 3 adenylate cyclase
VIRDLVNRLARVGVGAQAVPEQRRIVLSNYVGAIGAGTAVLYVIGYLAAGRRFWLGAVFNVGAVAMYLGTIWFNARGWCGFARRWLVFGAHVHVLLVSVYLGRAVGFHYYFFVTAPATFLLIAPTERGSLAMGSLLSLASFLWVQYGLRGAWQHVSPSAAGMLSVVAAASAFGMVVLCVNLFAIDAQRFETLLASEMERSERLLLNILPVSISQRLKRGDEPIADGFADVTVLFADIVGFTELSSQLGPTEIVRVLNRIFSEFDALTEKYPVEKIKTIGDAYMVASGLPEPRPGHVRVIVEMALEMRAAIARMAKETGYALDVRIGVHTGPVVAGVIGTRKFIYDLWGDTVNTASRMESHGVPGTIQVTQAVRDAVSADGFVLEERGEIQVKGKGTMKTWFLR